MGAGSDGARGRRHHLAFACSIHCATWSIAETQAADAAADKYRRRGVCRKHPGYYEPGQQATVNNLAGIDSMKGGHSSSPFCGKLAHLRLYPKYSCRESKSHPPACKFGNGCRPVSAGANAAAAGSGKPTGTPVGCFALPSCLLEIVEVRHVDLVGRAVGDWSAVPKCHCVDDLIFFTHPSEEQEDLPALWWDCVYVAHTRPRFRQWRDFTRDSPSY